MAKHYRPRFLLALAALALTLGLQVAPALAQRCVEHTIIDSRTGKRVVCEICCWPNGDCETRCR